MRLAFGTLSLAVLIATPMAASTAASPSVPKSLVAREQQVWTAAEHHAQFADVPHSTRTSCDASEPPQELTTPTPSLDLNADKLEVSFIVGADGKVHSPLILESAGTEQDSRILKAVSKWRFRPATCNGVATDAEAKIAFSAR
jgi:TonB family protein